MAGYQKFSATQPSKFGAHRPPNPPKSPKPGAGVQSDIRPLGELGALGGGPIQAPTLLPATRVSAPCAWSDAEEERAALVEYDGGAPRTWAEALARLDPARPPCDVLPHRWLQFIDDCGRFLDGGWADRAASVGWGPLELFGCDRERPFARIDHAGLLLLLNGGSLLALTRDTAVIETPTGARQTYHRHSIDVGRVMLAWEMADQEH